MLLFLLSHNASILFNNKSIDYVGDILWTCSFCNTKQKTIFDDEIMDRIIKQKETELSCINCDKKNLLLMRLLTEKGEGIID